eukprot:12652782-Prorocentrum_lima.AAC.1
MRGIRYAEQLQSDDANTLGVEKRVRRMFPLLFASTQKGRKEPHGQLGRWQRQCKYQSWHDIPEPEQK